MAMHIGPIVRAMNHSRTRVILIVLEIAVTLAIVTNCVNVILAERAKMMQPSGFDDANIVRIDVLPYGEGFAEPGVIGALIDSDLRAIATIPGVRAVANALFEPWDPRGSSSTFHRVDGVGGGLAMQEYYGTQDLIDTLGARIIEGRPFQEGDHSSGTTLVSPSVAIISKGLADVMFPDGDAIGKALRRGDPGEIEEDPLTIVGVIEHFHRPFVFDEDGSLARLALFVPARIGGAWGMPYLVRAEPGRLDEVIPAVAAALKENRAERAIDVRRVGDTKGRWFAGSRIVVATMSFIIVALVGLSALGLIGLTALSVSERTRQIGTRRALGATRSDILRHFLIENAIVTAAGLALGIIATYALNIFLVNNVTAVKIAPELIAAGIGILLLNAVLATVPPALRASKISPAVATRSV
ncbi:MAG TPA: FtsX-like permease family protein [Thermoanaerobaculia bacterium]